VSNVVASASVWKWRL